jgi:cyclopropane fatty-acyl-phospholipid synthase-like methyltransferase
MRIWRCGNGFPGKIEKWAAGGRRLRRNRWARNPRRTTTNKSGEKMAYDIFSIIGSGEAIKNPVSQNEIDIIISSIQGCSLLGPGDKMLDIACGSGEFLVRSAKALGIIGTGIEIQNNYVEEGKTRIATEGVSVEIIQDDAKKFLIKGQKFDAVSCMGASDIFGSFEPEVQALQSILDPSGKGVLIIGDMVWEDEPDEKAAESMGVSASSIPTLKRTLALFQDSGLSLLDIVSSDIRGWDRMQGAF